MTITTRITTTAHPTSTCSAPRITNSSRGLSGIPQEGGASPFPGVSVAGVREEEEGQGQTTLTTPAALSTTVLIVAAALCSPYGFFPHSFFSDLPQSLSELLAPCAL